jgi:hypothetical protein
MAAAREERFGQRLLALGDRRLRVDVAKPHARRVLRALGISRT